MNLKFDMCEAYLENVRLHPAAAVQLLGIEYEHATPQSILDQWWFWNCNNVPDVLPKYLTKLTVKAMDCIGRGLDKESAELLTLREASNDET